MGKVRIDHAAPDSTTLGRGDSYDKINLKMQKMQQVWNKIPEAKRGGDESDLVEQLLDKVKGIHPEWVSYVRAFSRDRGAVIDAEDAFPPKRLEVVGQLMGGPSGRQILAGVPHCPVYGPMPVQI